MAWAKGQTLRMDRKEQHADVDPSATDQPVPSTDPEFAERVLASMQEVFWDPEIERRGGLAATGPIHKALAILNPGKPVEIRLNDECQLVARARVNSAVKRGDPVNVENVDSIESLEPLDVDPDAGWVVLAVLPDGRQFAQFDFVRNRGRSLRLIALSREYIATARGALLAGRMGPATENAMAAAELAVTARTYSLETDLPQSGSRRNAHSARLHWTRVHVALGNTVATAHATLCTLNGLRPSSRYGEGALPDRGQIEPLLESVEQLVEDSERRIGPLLRTQDPGFVAIMNADQ